MGIVINLYLIPHRIAPEEWRKVYQESLKLVEAFDFMDRIEARRNGLQYFFARKSEDREGFLSSGGHGWLSVGDLRTGEVTGEFMLAEDIQAYLPGKPVKDQGEEILLNGLEGIEGIKKPRGCVNIWGGQTRGGSCHIYLLAIACLIVSRLPEASMVSGSISAGQCKRAVRWADRHLTEPVDLPVTGQMKRLLKRLRACGLSGMGLLRAFLQLTDEAKDERMGEFLRKEFTAEELYDHYRQRFLPYQTDQRGFARVMKEYLEMGFSFRELLRLVVEDPQGVRAEPEAFLRRVLEAKLHIRDKEIYDFAETARERADQEEPDRDKELPARIFCLLTGMENKNVNAFYPLDKIREDCKHVFGDLCRTDSLIDALVAEEAEKDSRRESIQSILYDNEDGLFRQKVSEQSVESGEGQDQKNSRLNSYKDLYGFVPGCAVKPELEENLIRNFHAIHKYTEETFEEFRILKKEERENYLIQKAIGTLFPEAVWDRIFERIMDDGYIERVYGILSINRGQGDGELFCRSLFSNMTAIDHYWEKTQK